MDATEKAGVVTAANWTNTSDVSGILANLVDSKGAATSLSLDYSGDPNTWSNSIPDIPGNQRMMAGYLDTGSQGTTTVTVSGLDATKTYFVYVYAVGDTLGRLGIYSIGSQTIYLKNAGFSGVFVPAASTDPTAPDTGNYMLFTVSGQSSFSLNASAPQTTAINGIQVVLPAPPPPPPTVAPAALTATAYGAAAGLAWMSVDVATSYNVYRSISSGIGYQKINATPVYDTAYVDGGLTPGTKYYYVVTAINDGGEGPRSNEASVIPLPLMIGTGDGLYGQYYAGDDLLYSPITNTTSIFSAVAPIINFDGFSADPTGTTNGVANSPGDFPDALYTALGASGNDFTAHWTGAFQSPVTGPITFTLTSDDGSRLFIDGVQVIDNSRYQPPTAVSYTTNMNAGEKHAFAADYFQGQYGATVQLFYSYPGQSPIILPQTQLYSLSPATVTGNIALESVTDLSAISSAAPLGAFHIGFRSPGTLTEVQGFDVTLTTTSGSANGAYSLSGVTPGTYDVTVKGSKNLRVLLPNVTISGATGTLADVTLPAGDANNDNSVDTSDFSLLVGSYGGDSNVPGSGYDPAEDFNFDGVIDTSDFSILVGEYGSVGAN